MKRQDKLQDEKAELTRGGGFNPRVGDGEIGFEKPRLRMGASRMLKLSILVFSKSYSIIKNQHQQNDSIHTFPRGARYVEFTFFKFIGFFF
jgi:hypothetical protein